MLIGVFVSSMVLRVAAAHFTQRCARYTQWCLLSAAAGLLVPAITKFALVRWSLFTVMGECGDHRCLRASFVSRPDGVCAATRR